MAALCPGRQYGLSSQESFGANKDLIFVKLTDSALKTIEEYVRNQSKFNKSPTIKFLGNEGQLSFPSQHHNGSTSFNFSLSSTTDMEGPGGSFECVQQSGRGSLAALGPVSHKLRIHANDDVYETTRHRMSVAEENHKNKCVREIKMNQTDIGRKVKVKQMPGRSVPPPPRETMSMRDAIMKPSPYQPAVNMPSKPPQPPSHGPLNGLSNGLGSNQVSSSKPQNKPSMPDIAKRPIKERMIHLLALRPFKKPELYERLNKEGLREKNAMTSVLKQIACLRDNSYHLNRAMWNDVHEDWPFYTDSERQMLKRRKPQNLTPPGSSDGGSSGSGHSPTSTHPGSPPPPVSASVPSKRPGYFDGVDGLPTKRPRVSHFQKPTEQPQAGYRPPAENNTQRRPMTDSRDASNMNPRSRESPTTNGYHGHVHNHYDKRTNSDDEDHTTTTTSTTTINSRKREKTETPPPPQVKHVEENKRNKEVLVDRTSVTNGVLLNGNRAKQEEKKDRHHGRVSSSTQNRIARVSPDSQSDRIVAPPPTDEFPDYVQEFTSIRDVDQRRRYKAEFNANYAEYRHLHGVVEKVSQRFTELEERLKQEDNSSPRYKDIKKQIVKEYQQNKQDKEHQKAKRRFQYLHEKLSHIKRLVCEYDQEVLQESHY